MESRTNPSSREASVPEDTVRKERIIALHIAVSFPASLGDREGRMLVRSIGPVQVGLLKPTGPDLPLIAIAVNRTDDD